MLSQRITLTSCQEKALALLNSAENVFLTGVAGSGKSFLLGHYFKNKDRKYHALVASTGAAAVLVKGVTFHSFFGIGIMEGGFERTVEKASRDKRVKKRLKRVVSVVIDEVSMISGQALKAAETICREVREKNIPWGGIRVIAVGDFGQLPPVNPHSEEKDWAFQSETWRKTAFQVAYLKTVMRSKDEDFQKVLNFVRDGIINDTVTQFLNGRLHDLNPEFRGTILFAHRNSVEDFNLKKLEGLPGKVSQFKTQYAGTQKFLEQIKRSAPIPETLVLKVGALVMIRKNDPDLKFVNGTLGTIKSINEDSLLVSLRNGCVVGLERESFTQLNAEGEEIASARNFPVNLAWATTIHKSQGMTLDLVSVDLSKVFEAGQAYVALSRVKTVDGLYLTSWDPKVIRASPEVMVFHKTVWQ